jgi:Bacterial SH3 domain
LYAPAQRGTRTANGLHMAVRTSHVTTRSAKYSLGPGAELPIARIVAVLLLVLPVAAWFVITREAKQGPSEAAIEIASFNPKQAFSDNTPGFLPTPVAALPPDTNASAPPPAVDESAPPSDAAESVKVANTGGLGAILRADPPRGKQLATLRDGQQLELIERQTVDDSEWLHVRTADGLEGWIFGPLVGPAD